MVHPTSFIGFFRLGTDDVWFIVNNVDLDDVPDAADSDEVNYRVYKEDGTTIKTGTATIFDNVNLVGAYKVSFTPSAPDFDKGKSYHVACTWLFNGDGRRADFRFILI